MGLHVAQVVLHFPVRNRIGPETYDDDRPNQLWRQPFSVACDFMLRTLRGQYAACLGRECLHAAWSVFLASTHRFCSTSVLHRSDSETSRPPSKR